MPLAITQFRGGSRGDWLVKRIEAVRGDPLAPVSRLSIVEGALPSGASDTAWILRGVASYERYVVRSERMVLEAQQPALGRSSATCAALIPVAKSAAWWALPQDERRAIFEARSHHIDTGARYLPAIARRLYQSRDLGEAFDFLTWFEYAPTNAAAFEELVEQLRRTEEWQYVDREIDLRLQRAAS